MLNCNEETPRIRVVIVDDHSILRSGLRMLINTQPDMMVVGEIGDSETAIELVQQLEPDVVLMDLTLPGLDGITATRRIKCQTPNTKVLVLTMHEDTAYLKEAIQAGASGYIIKRAADTDLLSAIRTVHHGGMLVFSDILDIENGLPPEKRNQHALPHKTSEGQEISESTFGDTSKLQLLSDRERDIFRLLALGYTNQEIADSLFISVKTAETYRARVMEKLQLKRRSELVRLALAAGVIK